MPQIPDRIVFIKLPSELPLENIIVSYGMERDHAGHLIADVFGVSPELDNLVSQAKNVNLKQYREIEREWEKALKKVPPDNITDLKIEIIYDGNNVRPNAFNIKYKKNGRVIKVPTIYN